MLALGRSTRKINQPLDSRDHQSYRKPSMLTGISLSQLGRSGEFFAHRTTGPGAGCVVVVEIFLSCIQRKERGAGSGVIRLLGIGLNQHKRFQDILIWSWWGAKYE